MVFVNFVFYYAPGIAICGTIASIPSVFGFNLYILLLVLLAAYAIAIPLFLTILSDVDQLILQPALKVVLKLSGKIPIHFFRFLYYAKNTLLLQEVNGKYEFTHLLLKNHFAISDFLVLLNSASSAECINILNALAHQGIAALEIIQGYIGHTDFALSKIAIKNISLLPSRAVLPILLTVLDTEKNIVLRSATLEGLPYMYSEDAILLLEKAIDDANDVIALQAITSIPVSYLRFDGNIGDKIARHRSKYLFKALILRTIEEMPELHSDYLLVNELSAIVLDVDEYCPRSSFVSEIVTKYKIDPTNRLVQRIIICLKEMLSNNEGRRRTVASLLCVRALSLYGKEWQGIVVSYLDDKYPVIRFAAINSLPFNVENSVYFIKACGDRESIVRVCALKNISCFVSIHDDALLRAILKNIEDKNMYVRTAALGALLAQHPIGCTEILKTKACMSLRRNNIQRIIFNYIVLYPQKINSVLDLLKDGHFSLQYFILDGINMFFGETVRLSVDKQELGTVVVSQLTEKCKTINRVDQIIKCLAYYILSNDGWLNGRKPLYQEYLSCINNLKSHLNDA
jgi:HEAT repeat protein